jgi:hypothetical protein
MSAWLLNEEHIGVLANAMSRAGVTVAGERLSPKQMAIALANANWLSIGERYPDQEEFMSGGQTLIAYRAQCAREACRPDPSLKPIDFIKMAQCFSYQACEAKQFREAHYMTEWIGQWHVDSFIGDMLRKMPGYDDAPWQYERPADAPEVIDLYAEIA